MQVRSKAESLTDSSLICNVRLMNEVNTHAEGVDENLKTGHFFLFLPKQKISVQPLKILLCGYRVLYLA
ncbi:hypothetical protein ACE1ET_14195 [Saccharicrinis sp. FJH62]|uniref:hypothetical protein n=1 Tax=Saccharicrinis sp. FJH62 TaxID=3344657 RepID=UPI0035D43990